MSDDRTPRAHEPPDVPARRTLLFGAMFFGIVLAALGAAAGVMHAFGGVLRPGASRTTLLESRVEAERTEQLRQLRAWETDQLSTYGWVDRRAGIVRIPIERAMALAVERSGR